MGDMDNEELLTRIAKLEKKMDKLLNLNTKIAKALHLLPVTEKEERAIQLAQRESLRIAAKVNDDLNAMENKPNDEQEYDLFSTAGADDLFSSVLADDYMRRTDR